MSFAKRFLVPTGLAASLVFSPTPVLAQANPDIANCEEIQDDATRTQAEICASHLGCRLVFKMHDTCVKAKRFLTRLRDISTNLFGSKPTDITADAVFTAAVPPAPLLERNKEIAPLIKRLTNTKVEEGYAEVKYPGGSWTYYGGLANGKPHGLGIQITGNTLAKAQFNNGKLGDGQLLMVRPQEGFLKLSTVRDSKQEGLIATQDERGNYTVGTFVSSSPDPKLIGLTGVSRGATSKTLFEGRLVDGYLVEGWRKDLASSQITTVGSATANQSYADAAAQWNSAGTRQNAAAGARSSPPVAVRASQPLANIAPLPPGSRYKSVCSRNLDKVHQAIKSGQVRAPQNGVRFLDDVYELYFSILRPCAGYDEEAKEEIRWREEARRERQQRCASDWKDTAMCSEWGTDPEANRRWHGVFTSRAREALADPLNYSTDLDKPQAIASRGVGRCERDYTRLQQQMREAQLRRPASATRIDDLNLLLWMTQQSVNLGKGACKGSDKEAELAGMQAQFDSARRACVGIATHEGVCKPVLPW